MSRTVTAWVVVDPATGIIYETAMRQVTAEALARDYGDGVVIELAGELPDPPHEWKVGDWYVIEDQPGIYQIAAPAVGGTFYVLHHVEARKHVKLLEYVSMSAKPASAIPCDPPAWFTEGGAS